MTIDINVNIRTPDLLEAVKLVVDLVLDPEKLKALTADVKKRTQELAAAQPAP